MSNANKQLLQWLTDEKAAGAPNPQQAILSSIDQHHPHARVVALRIVDEDGLVFFTQQNTRKVKELTANPNAVLTFWFELLQREVVVEGRVLPLSDAENKSYWQAYPREAQVRFHSYAPTSTQVIDDKETLEKKRKSIRAKYQNTDIPYTPLYIGFKLVPNRYYFYAYQSEQLSDVFDYSLKDGEWIKRLRSP